MKVLLVTSYELPVAINGNQMWKKELIKEYLLFTIALLALNKVLTDYKNKKKL